MNNVEWRIDDLCKHPYDNFIIYRVVTIEHTTNFVVEQAFNLFPDVTRDVPDENDCFPCHTCERLTIDDMLDMRSRLSSFLDEITDDERCWTNDTMQRHHNKVWYVNDLCIDRWDDGILWVVTNVGPFTMHLTPAFTGHKAGQLDPTRVRLNAEDVGRYERITLDGACWMLKEFYDFIDERRRQQ